MLHHCQVNNMSCVRLTRTTQHGHTTWVLIQQHMCVHTGLSSHNQTEHSCQTDTAFLLHAQEPRHRNDLSLLPKLLHLLLVLLPLLLPNGSIECCVRLLHAGLQLLTVCAAAQAGRKRCCHGCLQCSHCRGCCVVVASHGCCWRSMSQHSCCAFCSACSKKVNRSCQSSTLCARWWGSRP